MENIVSKKYYYKEYQQKYYKTNRERYITLQRKRRFKNRLEKILIEKLRLLYVAEKLALTTTNSNSSKRDSS